MLLIYDLLMRLSNKRLLTFCLLVSIAPAALTQEREDVVSEGVVAAETTVDEPTDPIEESDADAQAASIAQKLSNPVASLISVPIQINYDDKYGHICRRS